jgi:aldoxime dehydratase
MAYFGVQYCGDAPPPLARTALSCIASALDAEKGAKHWDRAQYIDEFGFTNVISIGYWDDPHTYSDWSARHCTGWAGGAFSDPSVGTFLEALTPAVERFETLFSADVPEGVAGVAQGMSVPIQEHAYWGSMRERIPLSQTDEMSPRGAPKIVTAGLHQLVTPHENICLIRSGQDWSATDAEERRMYIEDVEPILRAGMAFLRDEGLAVDCFANRYMTVVDAAGHPMEKSFGMSWWRSLAALERWAESHPTHVAIFGAAMKYLGTLGPAAKLRLYHEVTVASADEQYFEYYNCHSRTGMLRSAT